MNPPATTINALGGCQILPVYVCAKEGLSAQLSLPSHHHFGRHWAYYLRYSLSPLGMLTDNAAFVYMGVYVGMPT